MKKKTLLSQLLLLTALLLPAAPLWAASQTKANLVCFVKFADETDDVMFVDHPFDYYEQLFNDKTAGAQSVYNYFKHSSYGQLDWNTTFFPAPNGTKITSYTASQPRGFYQEQSSINPDGWEDATSMAARERALMKEIIAYVDQNLGTDVVVDADADGLVDNLTIILSSCSELGSRHMLWPHRSDLVSATGEFTINGSRVVGYLIVFDEYRAQLTAPTTLGTICHETSHSLGTYDLYHVSGSLNPVGVWDLMSDNQDTPQQMMAYTKYRYCKWIDEIPLISEPGTYTLNPVGGTTSENIAYKIQPVGRDEYFVVEYRKKEGYDSSIPESGLLVYRINPNQSGGNVGYNGTTRLDEQYIFRPGGTTTSDGNILQAAFSKESGRTAFGGLADEKPFYSDGTLANFAIANVSACGETISFDLLETTHQLILSEESFTLKGQANSGATLTISSDDGWQLSGVPAWLTVSPTSGDAGTATVSIVANADNDTGSERTAQITVSSTTDAQLTRTFTVAQEAKAGNVILFDDFENTENPNGWTFENSGEANRGWQYTDGTPSGKAKKMVNSGTHAMSMIETMMEDLHQEARLTSPVFAGGKTLTFYSHTNGGNATPKVNPPIYIIEVSSDGGTTWTTIFDVLKDYPRDENGNTVTPGSGYTKIELDLSPYTSDNMRIRFNCYDTSQEGLQYWWQIDDLEITGESATGIYAVSIPVESQPVYDLRGIRIDGRSVPAGSVVVKGGKKVLK